MAFYAKDSAENFLIALDFIKTAMTLLFLDCTKILTDFLAMMFPFHLTIFARMSTGLTKCALCSNSFMFANPFNENIFKNADSTKDFVESSDF